MDSSMFRVPFWITLLWILVFSFFGWLFWEFIFYLFSFINITINYKG